MKQGEYIRTCKVCRITMGIHNFPSKRVRPPGGKHRTRIQHSRVCADCTESNANASGLLREGHDARAAKVVDQASVLTVDVRRLMETDANVS
jgi:hypothetical protein